MIKKGMLIFILCFCGFVIHADDKNNVRNGIIGSNEFWNMYTDALRGEKKAQFEVGVMYERGIGVEQNQTQAAKWYQKAAIQGHKDAQYNIGIMYAAGRGVEQNDQFAMMWLASSAKQGDKESRELLLSMIDATAAKTTAESSMKKVEKGTLTMIKGVRFETKEGARLCHSLEDNRECEVLKGKQTFTSRSKQGNYYKVSGIATGHGWQAYEGEGYIEMSMVELR